MDWLAFLRHVRHAKRDQSILSRVLLNTMGGEHSVPVDLRELRSISSDNRMALNAFLDWTIANPGRTLIPNHVSLLSGFIQRAAMVRSGTAAARIRAQHRTADPTG